MASILLNCSPPVSDTDAYAGPAFNFAVRALLRLGCALASAGLRVHACGTQNALTGRNAARALRRPGGNEIGFTFISDAAGFADTLARQRPTHCIIWNGSADPHCPAQCRAEGCVPWFAEAGWFDREASIFLDLVGVSCASSLAGFVPRGQPSEATIRLRLDMLARACGPSTRRVAEDYLLVLLDGDSWSYFDRRYAVVDTLIDDLAMRFPRRRIAVRGHPASGRDARALPPGMMPGQAGSVLDWAAHASAVIGASSKATFAAPLFGKPLILIGRGLTNPDGGGRLFAEAAEIGAITDEMLAGDAHRTTASRALLYEAAFHRHVYFDDTSERALSRNRLLAPVLAGAMSMA